MKPYKLIMLKIEFSASNNANSHNSYIKNLNFTQELSISPKIRPNTADIRQAERKKIIPTETSLKPLKTLLSPRSLWKDIREKERAKEPPL